MAVNDHNTAVTLAEKREQLIQENRQRTANIREQVTKKGSDEKAQILRELPAKLSATVESILGLPQPIPEIERHWFADPIKVRLSPCQQISMAFSVLSTMSESEQYMAGDMQSRSYESMFHALKAIFPTELPDKVCRNDVVKVLETAIFKEKIVKLGWRDIYDLMKIPAPMLWATDTRLQEAQDLDLLVRVLYQNPPISTEDFYQCKESMSKLYRYVHDGYLDGYLW